ncbi:MAG: adenosine deaminase [Proteobacteria bacterium]|nr:adenosine deaminase [Pseudomonadota bacterium]
MIRRDRSLPFAAAIAALLPGVTAADEASTAARLAAIHQDPPALRQFMREFPKGGDLHNHLHGSVYAESVIGWAAADGRCVVLATAQLGPPPCDPAAGRPTVAAAISEAGTYERLVDAYSVRNYERRPVSGHDQFFATFGLFFPGTVGHEGELIAEAAARRGAENTVYLELMQSFGMSEAASLALATPGRFAPGREAAALAGDPALAAIAREAREALSRYEHTWRERAGCGTPRADAGCGVTVRYLAQVIRTLPPEAVHAQIVLGFLLADADPRYVGLNLVAPEDDRHALADYANQMQEIARLRQRFPKVPVTLHAGELTLGLVPPEALRDHIRQAVEVAGARRIGHGIDVALEDRADELLATMAKRDVLVEINLTSNAVIGGLAGAEHPFLLYRRAGVPTALAADDEGVLRIDLTNEYVRAALTYPLDYADFKALSRNALAYAFVPGERLLTDTRTGQRIAACVGSSLVPEQATAACRAWLAKSEKGRLQAELERRLEAFEAAH